MTEEKTPTEILLAKNLAREKLPKLATGGYTGNIVVTGTVYENEFIVALRDFKELNTAGALKELQDRLHRIQAGLG